MSSFSACPIPHLFTAESHFWLLQLKQDIIQAEPAKGYLMNPLEAFAIHYGHQLLRLP